VTPTPYPRDERVACEFVVTERCGCLCQAAAATASIFQAAVRCTAAEVIRNVLAMTTRIETVFLCRQFSKNFHTTSRDLLPVITNVSRVEILEAQYSLDFDISNYDILSEATYQLFCVESLILSQQDPSKLKRELGTPNVSQ